jgi:hypothetical protein
MANVAENKKVGPLAPTLQKDIKDKRVLAIDVIGPLPETAKGNKYIIISVSLDDMWPDAEAHKAVSQTEIVKHVQMRTRQEGAYDEIWSDRGSNIIGMAAVGYYTDYGLIPRTTTSNNHQGAGAIEAQVKKLKEKIAKLVQVSGDPWDEVVDVGIMHLRKDKLSDFGASPFELRFKRQMRMPAHLQFGLDTHTIAAQKEQEYKGIVDKLADDAALEQKERFDKNRAQIKFEVGQQVWLRDHYKKTFGPKRVGPFEIAEKKSDLSYKIKEVARGPKLGRRYDVINARDLKKYESAEEVVKKVISHYGEGDDMTFKIEWADGTKTWEPFANLFDVTKSGTVIYNMELAKYAADHQIQLPKRRRLAGDVEK